jgi:hypothetical protein
LEAVYGVQSVQPLEVQVDPIHDEGARFGQQQIEDSRAHVARKFASVRYGAQVGGTFK